jgi:hypothetical protein
VALGIPAKEVAEFRSLKLLSTLVEMARLCNMTGLDCRTQAVEVFARCAESSPPALIAKLSALNDLRQLADHRGGGRLRTRLTNALAVFGIDPASASSGYGSLLDQIYDGVIETLKVAYETLRQGLS